MTTLNIVPNSVDQLGMLLAQIADLTKQADAIKDSMKDVATSSDIKSFEGSLFKSTFCESNRSIVDYKTLCVDLNVSTDTIAKYTRTTAVFSIKTTSR